ncbi:MAG: EAL domain-containing protein [Actinomycetia bacterium]|nr:EAL domain-containing protein [Actinomycetes bacterium]
MASRVRSSTAGWILILAVSVACTAALATAIDDAPIVGAPHVAMLWIVGAFVAAEVFSFKYEFRREPARFTLTDVPIIVGVLFAGLGAVVVGAAAATVVAVAVGRRRPMLTIAFETTTRFTQVVAVAWVINRMTDPVATFDSDLWTSIGVAVAAAHAVALLVDLTARRLGGNSPHASGLLANCATSAYVAGVGAASSLIAATLVATNPASALLIAVPAAAVGVAQIASRLQQAHDESVRFLHDSPSRAVELADGDRIAKLITRAGRELGATSVELVVFDADAAGTAVVVRNIDGRTFQHQLDDVASLVLHRQATLTPDATRLTSTDTSRLAGLEAAGAISAIAGSIHRVGEPIALLVSAGRMSSGGASERDLLAKFDRFRHKAESILVKQQIERDAAHDSLTGLPNQDVFDSRTEAALHNSSQVAALRIDLDDFAMVNDTLGHAAGDAVLSVISVRIQRCLGQRDIAARFDSDEFGVLLIEPTDPLVVATKIVEEVHKPINIAGQNVSVGVSVGVSTSANDATADDLLTHADSAMHTAKQHGKGVVTVFGQEPIAVDGGPVRTSLAVALDEDDNNLNVVYQPIHHVVRNEDGMPLTTKVVGYEALARWRSDEQRTVESTFIEQAEAEGVIATVDGKVMETVLADQLRLFTATGGGFVAVNVSPMTLADDSFAERIGATIERAGVDPRSVMIEISERTLVEQPAMVVRQLRALERLGIPASIDGFGTGGTTFAVLKQAPVRFVKLAVELVENVESNADQAATVIDLAHSLGIEVVAHGIERQEQLDTLTSIGCDYAQGFLLGHPEAAPSTQLV